MCKIEFNDQELRKMKRSNGIELLKFSIEKVLNKYGKWFLKMRGNPDISLHNTHTPLSTTKQSSVPEQLTTSTSPENIYDEVTWIIIIDCDESSTYWQNHFDFLWI